MSAITNLELSVGWAFEKRTTRRKGKNMDDLLSIEVNLTKKESTTVSFSGFIFRHIKCWAEKLPLHIPQLKIPAYFPYPPGNNIFNLFINHPVLF
jgi:hypothetical protein